MSTVQSVSRSLRGRSPKPPTSTDLLWKVVHSYSRSAMAERYPFHDHEFDHHRFLVDLGLKFLNETAPATILDIGTGRGIIPRFFARFGHRAVTLDFPVTGSNEALDSAALEGVQGHECDCSSERLPLDSNSVDCVYLVDVIEHFPHSPKFMLEEIHRVLRPGGIIIDSTFNSVRLTVRLKMLLGYSNWPRVNDFYDVSFHGGHHHEYTEAELRFVHEQAGFQNLEVHFREMNSLFAGEGMDSLQSGLRPPGGSKPKLRLLRRMLYSVAQIAPGLRSQMYLVSKK
jgi:ubiquinone/menaquinone biosynthesis C-methylase UbiE